MARRDTKKDIGRLGKARNTAAGMQTKGAGMQVKGAGMQTKGAGMQVKGVKK